VEGSGFLWEDFDSMGLRNPWEETYKRLFFWVFGELMRVSELWLWVYWKELDLESWRALRSWRGQHQTCMCVCVCVCLHEHMHALVVLSLQKTSHLSSSKELRWLGHPHSLQWEDMRKPGHRGKPLSCLLTVKILSHRCRGGFIFCPFWESGT
jgi:hypothetical protein